MRTDWTDCWPSFGGEHWIWTSADDPAAPALLDSAEINADGVLPGPLPAALDAVLALINDNEAEDAAGRLMVVGTRWVGELEFAASRRLCHGAGRPVRDAAAASPTYRGTDAAGLADHLLCRPTHPDAAQTS